MDFNSVPEASNKVKISLALIVFLLISSIVATIFIMRYVDNINDRLEKALEKEKEKPKTEVMANSQIDHIDMEVHELAKDYKDLESSLAKAIREIQWLKENCRCR